MFEFCGVRNVESLKFFLNVIEKNYMNYFNESESPFDISLKEAEKYELFDNSKINDNITDDFDDDDYSYLEIVNPDAPAKIIPFPKRN